MNPAVLCCPFTFSGMTARSKENESHLLLSGNDKRADFADYANAPKKSA
jgi:hypothetical protein